MPGCGLAGGRYCRHGSARPRVPTPPARRPRLQYLASVLFLAELSRGTGPIPRTYFHVAAAPHIPDHALIVGEVLRLHRERQAAQARQTQQAQQRLEPPPAQ